MENYERAVEVAGEYSAAPGPGGKPLCEWLEVRPFYGSPCITSDARVNEALLRELIPAVTGVLVRRGADFARAEDAVQDALLRALATWPTEPPEDPKGWLITAAWRKFLDANRAESSRLARETRVAAEPAPGPTETRPTPCSSTSCAPTLRSRRPPRWRSRCGRWAA